ncbi:MAG: glycosyltransferase [Deltaproteobacteria bacterium]|nr:glycosyltransferase [Deltaproteobacteria bacterium]
MVHFALLATIALSLWTACTVIVGLWAMLSPSVQPLLVRVQKHWAKPPRTLPPLVAPSVLVLRPCSGADPELSRNLCSLARTTQASRDALSLTCLLLVDSARDPAWPTAVDAAQWLTEQGIPTAVLLTHARGPNHKCDQLARGVAHSPESAIVLVADADVDLTHTDLTLFTRDLAHGTHAALWAPVPESPTPRTLGDRASLAVLTGSLHAFALLARLDPASLVGKLFALRADALALVGGFASLTRDLGEDMALAHALRAQSLSVRAIAPMALSTAHDRSWSQARARYARWLMVIRTQRPALLRSYPLLFASPIAQVLCALALSLWAPRASLTLALTVIFARSWVSAHAIAASGQRRTLRRVLCDPWLADVLLWGAYRRARTMTEVQWRDTALRFDSHGKLLPTHPAPSAEPTPNSPKPSASPRV